MLGRRNGLVPALAGLLAGVAATQRASAHLATVTLEHDPSLPFYVGTANPGGTASSEIITMTTTSAGFLNGIGGGVDDGAAGEVAVTPPTQNLVLVGLSLHVTDTAGPSHSLSSLNDPALADIIADLAKYSNITGVGAYDFNNPPPGYSGYAPQLAAGESTYGGQPFDILLSAQNTGSNGLWNVSFNGEIGALDGITAINVTDIGAVTPEPTTALWLLMTLLPMIYRHRKR